MVLQPPMTDMTDSQPGAALIRIYSTRTCGPCRRAKALLTSKGVAFEEIDVTTNHQLRAEVADRTGWRTVPMIFVGDHFIGGYEDLLELEADGELDLVLGLSSAAD
jgi:glutaredoxin 3